MNTAAKHRTLTTSSCRSCRAPIVWTVTEHGRKMPVDADPYAGDHPAGLFVLRSDPVTRGFLAIATTPDAFPGEPVYRSHFTTCPDRDEWRR